MAKVIINEISIRKKFVESAQKGQRMEAFMRNAASARVVGAKEELLKNFDSHDATKELQGSAKSRTSKFLSKGNLIAFLGLSNPKELVAQVREYLRSGIQLRKDKARIYGSGNKINFDFKVQYPTKTEVFEAFPAPDNYSSLSWLQIIEKGIHSIIWYIFWSKGFNTDASRSGTGLEVKGGNIKNVADFQPQSYISGLIEKFVERFRR